MPIEIRELIIKTAISTGRSSADEDRERELNMLKKKLLEECRKMISVSVKRNNKR